jgi:hypothetical protein
MLPTPLILIGADDFSSRSRGVLMWIARLLAIVLVIAAQSAAPVAAADVPPGEDTPAAEAIAPPARLLATRTFGGGQRLVVGTVRASMPASMPGIAIELVVSLYCGSEGIGDTQNVGRGTTARLTPRLLFRDARTCSLWARSVGFGLSAGKELVMSGALRSVGAPVGARGYHPTGQPVLLAPGEAVEVVPATLTVPVGVLTLRVIGDVKTTACTSYGGSRENGSPYLCIGHVDPTGSFIRVSVVLRYPGSACPATVVSMRNVFDDAIRHHVMTFQSGIYLVPVLRLCGSTVRVSVVVQVLAGSDLVVHAHGTTSAVFPALWVRRR